MLDTLTVADLTHGGGVTLAKVKHELVLNTTSDALVVQTAHNLARGLPELVARPDRGWCDNTVSLCGSAPSLMQNLHRLRGDVMACNAAIPAMHKAGVALHYAMIWDATPEMVRYCIDIPGCEWMIASRCHPSVIDKLLALGQRVTLWHTGTTEDAMKVVYGPGRLWVLGGPTIATRGPFLLGAMGYRNLHLFGADSSFADETHVGGSLRKEEEVACSYEGRIYRTTYWMMNQAETWVKFVLPQLAGEPEPMMFTVHGEGLLPAAHRSWLRQELPWHKRLAWWILA